VQDTKGFLYNWVNLLSYLAEVYRGSNTEHQLRIYHVKRLRADLPFPSLDLTVDSSSQVVYFPVQNRPPWVRPAMSRRCELRRTSHRLSSHGAAGHRRRSLPPANWRGSGLQAPRGLPTRQRAPDAAASRRGAGSRHGGPSPWPRQAHAQRHRASASSHLDVDAPNTPATRVEERRHIPVEDATVLVLRRYASTRKASRSLEKLGTS